MLGFRRLATLRSLSAPGMLRQDIACSQAAVGPGIRRRHMMPYGAGQLQWLAPMLARKVACPARRRYMTVATTSSSFSAPTWFCTASISSYRFVVTVADLCVGFNGGFSRVFIVFLLCLLRLFWRHNVKLFGSPVL